MLNSDTETDSVALERITLGATARYPSTWPETGVGFERGALVGVGIVTSVGVGTGTSVCVGTGTSVGEGTATCVVGVAATVVGDGVTIGVCVRTLVGDGVVTVPIVGVVTATRVAEGTATVVTGGNGEGVSSGVTTGVAAGGLVEVLVGTGVSRSLEHAAAKINMRMTKESRVTNFHETIACLQ